MAEEVPECSSAVAGSSAADDNVEVALDSLSLEALRMINGKVSDDHDNCVIVETVTPGEQYVSANKFEDLEISLELLKGLYVQMKFEKPSKIQAASLPMILTPPYKNMMAQAHNGSGKTTCFVIGMLSRVDPARSEPQALCICPTRELTVQNMEVLLKMGKFTGITSELAIPMDIPLRYRLPISAHVVIGTPGIISNMILAKKLSMKSMKILVFDEADLMLAENAFRVQSTTIMKNIAQSSPDCQVLLFSATFNEEVKTFTDKTIKETFKKEDYNQMLIKKEELSLASVKQYKVNCPNEAAKLEVVKDKILELGDRVGQTIVFVQTRKSALALRESLKELGYEVSTILGSLSPADRDQIVKEFREGLTSVLISTDILSRGFDQQMVNLVVNYDLPVVFNKPSEPDYEVYLHRIGRAGRFGRKGAVFNLLCSHGDKQIMQKIERHYNCEASEIGNWQSEEEFKDALKKAGLA